MQKSVDSPAEKLSWGFRLQKSIFIVRGKKKKTVLTDIPLPVLPFHPPEPKRAPNLSGSGPLEGYTLAFLSPWR